MGRVIHGAFTVKTPSGAYQEIEFQIGTVSNIGSSPVSLPTKITVTSSDKTAMVYTVTSSTVVDSQAGGISAVSNGDTVRIEAEKQGNGFTAMNIVDVTKIGASRAGFGFGRAAPPVRTSGDIAPAPQGSAL